MVTEEDVAALRAWAEHMGNASRAAFGLLDEHDFWLWNDEFGERCVKRLSDGTVYLDFAEMERLHHDRPGCSEGQAAILLAAADIGSGRWRIHVMDVRNRDRLVRAGDGAGAAVIPVRVPASMMPVLAVERRFSVQPEHPMYEAQCPVCDGLLGETVVVLVFAGIEPQDRKDAGWITGAAVAVHAFCAGVPAEQPEKPRRTVTLDITDPDADFALVQALQDFAERERDQAKYEGGHESRERWAAAADKMRAQAEAAG